MALSRTATILLTLGEKSYRTAVGTVAKLDDSQRRKIARLLIRQGFAWVVAHSLEHFAGFDAAIAIDLVRARQDLGGIVARNAWRFTDDERLLIAEALKDNGQAWALSFLPSP